MSSQLIAGRFQIVGSIGQGAMASVSRAHDSQTGQDVAIKVMHPHLTSDPTFHARFRQEAKAAAMLAHPNSVSIIDFGQDGEMLYIAMELIEGRDLGAHLRVLGPMVPHRAALALAMVCDALATAHRFGIIHRDLKPENIMITEHAGRPDEVKVLDFGIAKMAVRDQGGSPGQVGLTRAGVAMGTPSHMAPEQCKGQPIDGRADIYACGVLLHQLLTGRLPFEADNPFDMAAMQVKQPAEPPSRLKPDIPASIDAIVLCALEKDPQARYASAEEMADALRRAAQEIASVTAGVAQSAGPGPEALSSQDPRPAVPLNDDLTDTVQRNVPEPGHAPSPAERPSPGPGFASPAQVPPAGHAPPAGYAPPLAPSPLVPNSPSTSSPNLNAPNLSASSMSPAGPNPAGGHPGPSGAGAQAHAAALGAQAPSPPGASALDSRGAAGLLIGLSVVVGAGIGYAAYALGL